MGVMSYEEFKRLRNSGKSTSEIVKDTKMESSGKSSTKSGGKVTTALGGGSDKTMSYQEFQNLRNQGAGVTDIARQTGMKAGGSKLYETAMDRVARERAEAWNSLGTIDKIKDVAGTTLRGTGADIMSNFAGAEAALAGEGTIANDTYALARSMLDRNDGVSAWDAWDAYGNLFIQRGGGVIPNALDKLYDKAGNLAGKVGINLDTENDIFSRWNNMLQDKKAAAEKAFYDKVGEVNNIYSAGRDYRAAKSAEIDQEAQAKYGQSKAAQNVYKYGKMVGTQIPNAAVALVTAFLMPEAAPAVAGGLATATTEGLQAYSALQVAGKGAQTLNALRTGIGAIASDPNFWTAAVNETGSAYNEAIEAGVDPSKASAYAISYGVLSGMIEVGGADEALGGLQAFPKNVRKAIEENNVAKAAWEYGKSIVSEIGEEEWQGLLQNSMRGGMLGQNVPLYSTEDPNAIINPKQMLETAKDTAITTAILGAGERAMVGGMQKIADSGKYYGNSEQALRSALEASATEEERRLITEIQNKAAVRSAKKGDSSGYRLNVGEARQLQDIIRSNKGEAGVKAAANANWNAQISSLSGPDGVKSFFNSQRFSEENRYELDDSQAEEIYKAYNPNSGQRFGDYLLDMREAFVYGAKGLSADHMFAVGQGVKNLTEQQAKIAWTLGQGQSGGTVNAVDVKTDEGKQKAIAAFAALGDYAESAADTVGRDQDLDKTAAAMNKAVNLYAAQGGDLQQAYQNAKSSGDILAYLTPAQIQTAQEIGQKVRADNLQRVQQKTEALARIREMADGGEIMDLNAAIAEARKYIRMQQSALNNYGVIAEQLRKGDPNVVNDSEYQKLIGEMAVIREDIANTEEMVRDYTEKRNELREKTPGKRKKGTVSFTGGTIEGVKYEGVDESKLDRNQKRAVAAGKIIADAIGIDVVFFNGETGGKRRLGAWQGDTLYVNVNSSIGQNGSAQFIAAATMSHELTHFLQQYDPQIYQELKDFVVGHILKADAKALDQLVKEQMTYSPQMSYDQALDEVVANACQTMLMDSRAITELARENMTLAEKIADVLEEIAGRLRTAFEGVNVQDGDLFRAVRLMEGQLDTMQEIWDKGMRNAAENYRAAQAVKAEVEGNGTQYMSWGDQQKGKTTNVENASDEYINAADGRIVDFIHRVLGLKDVRYRNMVRFTLNKAKNAEVYAIKELTGVDATGFENILTGGAVDHINVRHGVNGKADSSMADINDVSRIKYILANPDGAFLLREKDGSLSLSDVWRNSDHSRAKRVVFYKDIGGVFYVATATPDSNSKVVAVESAFIGSEKNKESGDPDLDLTNLAQQKTPEANSDTSALSKESIAEVPDGVNTDDIVGALEAVAASGTQNLHYVEKDETTVTNSGKKVNTLKFLNDQLKRGDVVHTFKAYLEEVDEKTGEVRLYAPMDVMKRSQKKGGKRQRSNYMSLNRWSESDANPNSANIALDLDDKTKQPKINPKTGNYKWVYNLEKGDGTVPAAYNPYQHSSDQVLNDQFQAAYKRPNIVVYECVIPKSEMTSGFHFRAARDSDGLIVEAKDPVGLHPWKTGDLAGQLEKTDRKVYLSRWLMPIRRLEDSEVAQRIKETLDKEDKRVLVPFNVVPPGLRAALEDLGVPFDYTGTAQYRKWHKGNPEKFPYAKPISEEQTAVQKATADTAKEMTSAVMGRDLEILSQIQDAGAKNQIYAFEEDRMGYRDMLERWGGMKAKDIDRLFQTVDAATEKIKKNLEALDYAWDKDIDDRAFSPVKDNSDPLYKISVDFSTLCRKRILQQTIANRLSEALDRGVTKEEGIAIRDALMALQEEGKRIEVACALCYVESARMRSLKAVNRFLSDKEGSLRAFWKATGELTEEQREILKTAESLPVTAFTTPEGIENLKKNHPKLYTAFNAKTAGDVKSKGIQNDVWYRLGDAKKISDSLIRKMNAENGLRTQSWSDFQVKHLMDYIAATIELSTRGAKMHAYTKVIDYVRLMGNTGVMINMSLIPTREYNGKLEYDNLEGFVFDEAMKLRDMFPETAGTICIGVEPNQIRQLLESTDIDYVIPYHMSGMSADTRRLMHIPAWNDFQGVQSEKKLEGKEAAENAKKYGVKLLPTTDPKWHKGPDFSEWYDQKKAQRTQKRLGTDGKYGVMTGGYMAMQQAAEQYKKICAERGLMPKFTYGEDNFGESPNYWKLLIDRKMVNNVEGNIIEQKPIKPIFDMDTVQSILDTELERYPHVKADQEEATERVVDAFLKGNIKAGMTSDEIAEVMQKPVDNLAKVSALEAAGLSGQETRNQMTEALKDERRMEELDRQIQEAQDALDIETDRKTITSLNNRLTKLEAEKDKLIAKERRLSRRTSIADLLENLSEYRKGDLMSIAEQYSRGAWDIEPDISRRELEAQVREALEERAADMTVLERQVPANGFYVRPVETAERMDRQTVQFQTVDDTYDDTAAEAEGREIANTRIQSEAEIISQMVESVRELTAAEKKSIKAIQDRLKIGKAPEVREKDARRLARAYIESAHSTLTVDDIAADIKALGDYIAQTEDMSPAVINQMAQGIASKLVSTAQVAVGDVTEDETMNRIRSRIAGQKLVISNADTGDIPGYENLNQFRKKNFGRFSVVDSDSDARTDQHVSVDSFYEELRNDFGDHYFPELGNQGEMLGAMAGYFDATAPLAVNPHAQYMGEVTAETALSLTRDVLSNEFLLLDLDTLSLEPMSKAERILLRNKELGEKLRQLEKEKKLSEREVGKLYNQITKLNQKLVEADQKYENLRQKKNERIAQVEAEGTARAMEKVAKEKERSAKKIQALKDHFADLERSARERREESAGATKYRKQIEQKAKKLYELLMTNSDEKHVPEVLKEPLAEFLQELNFTSKRQLRGGEETKKDQAFAANLQRLEQLLSNQQAIIEGTAEGQNGLGGYIDISQENLQYLKDVSQMITQALRENRGFTINSMSAGQLKQLSNFLSNLYTAINKMNAFMANARYENVREAAKNDIGFLKSLGKHKQGAETKSHRFLSWENGVPFYVFRRYGEGGRSIFDGFTRGWERLARHAQEIIDFTEHLYSDKEVREWKREIHDIRLTDGSEIRMTTAQIMELSVLLNREQALKHIEKGGIRIGDIDQGRKGPITDQNHYHLTDTDIVNITGLLTGRQAEVAKQRNGATRSACGASATTSTPRARTITRSRRTTWTGP